MYTSDKIAVKHISVKETFSQLDLEPKDQGYSKQQKKQGNKNMPPLNKQTTALLGNRSETDESNRL